MDSSGTIIKEYLRYTDGASRGNPGHSGAGAVIMDSSGITIKEVFEYLGIQTNNYSEYSALELVLLSAIELGIHKIKILTDSKLVVEQVSGNWKVKNQNLLIIHSRIIELLKNFDSVSIIHILRKLNTHADSLANKAIDRILK